MKIAVAGGSGFVGKSLIQELVGKHEVVSIDLKNNSKADKSIKCDISEKSKYSEYLEDVNTAFYFVHSLDASEELVRKEKKCAKAFKKACESSGVERVVFLSGMRTEKASSRHMESRIKTGEILGTGDYDFFELGSSMIIGSNSISFRILYQLCNRLPLMVGPKWLKMDLQPINIDDVVFYLSEIIDDSLDPGYYEIGGPEILSYTDLIKRTSRIIGKKSIIINTPFLTPRLSSYWLKFVTDVNFNVAKSLVESIKHEMVVKKEFEMEIERDLTYIDEALKMAVKDYQ